MRTTHRLPLAIVLAAAATGCLDKGYLDGVVAGAGTPGAYLLGATPAVTFKYPGFDASVNDAFKYTLAFMAENRVTTTPLLVADGKLMACWPETTTTHISTWAPGAPRSDAVLHVSVEAGNNLYHASFAVTPDGGTRYLLLTTYLGNMDAPGTGNGYAYLYSSTASWTWQSNASVMGLTGFNLSGGNYFVADLATAGTNLVLVSVFNGPGALIDKPCVTTTVYNPSLDIISSTPLSNAMTVFGLLSPYPDRSCGYLGKFRHATGNALAIAFLPPMDTKVRVSRMVSPSSWDIGTTFSPWNGYRCLEVRQGPDLRLHWLAVSTNSNCLVVRESDNNATGLEATVVTIRSNSGSVILQATMACLADGTLAVAWTERLTGNQHVWTALRRGTTWSAPICVTAAEPNPVNIGGTLIYGANPAFAGTGQLDAWPDAAYLRYVSGNMTIPGVDTVMGRHDVVVRVQ